MTWTCSVYADTWINSMVLAINKRPRVYPCDIQCYLLRKSHNWASQNENITCTWIALDFTMPSHVWKCSPHKQYVNHDKVQWNRSSWLDNHANLNEKARRNFIWGVYYRYTYILTTSKGCLLSIKLAMTIWQESEALSLKTHYFLESHFIFQWYSTIICGRHTYLPKIWWMGWPLPKVGKFRIQGHRSWRSKVKVAILKNEISAIPIGHLVSNHCHDI